MGFLGSIFSNDSGSGFHAQEDPNNIANLQQQQGIVSGAEGSLQGLANGTGPNPALAQLQAATNQNNANAAGIVASQKGINPALAARLAGMQSGQNNQVAANQAAGLQAQQQLGAINSLGQLGLGQQNATQSGINSANSSNAGIASTNAQGQQGILGGAVGGVGTLLGLAKGGMVPGYATGGPVSSVGQFLMRGQPVSRDPASMPMAQGTPLGQGFAGLIGGLRSLAGQPQATTSAAPAWGSTSADYKNLGTGNSIADYTSLPDAPAPAANAPQFMADEVMNQPQMGMSDVPAEAMAAKDGGKVPGKAEVKGDSSKNDVVPAVLSPGEIVIPRSVLASKNPALAAAHFVEQELAKQGQKKSKFADGGEVSSDTSADNSVDTDTGGSSPYVLNDQASADPVAQSVATPSIAAQALPAASMARQPGSEIPLGAQSMSPDLISGLQKGFNQQRAGAFQEAKALGEQGKAESAIAHQEADQLQSQQAQNQQKFMDLDQERQNLVNDVQNSHVDPNRLVGNMDTGKKISTAIGLILGGIGGGLTHQGNPALQYLQTQIDNDIKSQQADLGKKQNLLSANMQQFGNMKDAMAMTRANMMDIASAKLKEAAANAMDPLAKARALQQAGQLDLQSAQTIAPLKIQQQRLAQASQAGGDPSVLVPALVPAAHQKQVFSEIQQSQNASNSQQALMNAFDQATKENTVGARALRAGFTPPSIKTLNALADPLIHDNEGRINTLEQQHIQALFPAPGDQDATIEAKKNALQEFINHKKSAPTAKAFGIDLSQMQPPQAPVIKQMNGVNYQRVQGGWKRVS